MQLVNSLKLAKLIVFITLLFMIFLSYLSFQRIRNLIEYGNLIDQTNHLKYKTAECFSYLKDAETGQRGFLLTKDSSFLDPLHLAQKQIYASLDELTALAHADTENIPLIKEFQKDCISRMKFLESLITENNDIESYKGQNKGKLLIGKHLMDEARKMELAVNKNIEKKLKEREAVKNKYAVLTPLFTIGLYLVSILLIYLAYRIINNELKKRIAMQNELQYNVEALRISNSELEQFAYVASHDLQEPLRKIQSFGDRLMVKHKEKLDEDGQFIIERMQNSAERMQSLINDLLIYSRIANAKTKKFEAVDLNQSLNNVLDVLNEDVIKKEAIITNDKLPVVTANKLQMEQLFQNLLTNAMKFLPGNRKPVITIKYSEITGKEILSAKPFDYNKRFHKISVLDNGIGFEEQYNEKIFVIFQRLQGKSEFSGSGIGLAICKKIMINHEGYIVAQSKVNEGSEFSVYLPKG